MNKQRSLTTSRLGRLSMMGRLAGGLAGGMVSEGARQLVRGRRPTISDALLTPGNIRRLGDRLSEMRGAAMKVGQLLSMDSGEILPAEFSDLLARLREDAHQMPLGDVAKVLGSHWGDGWDRKFRRFDFTPIAAASIGQVHAAELRDGRRLAVKIQYPGIRQSIDSDVDNVATLLNLFNILPDGLDIASLLGEAKRQLHVEADYRAEAASTGQFARLLAGDARFDVPAVVEELSDTDVLAMQFLDGRPIESLDEQSKEVRDAASVHLVQLALHELFDWGLVQTDPNFANYLFDPNSRRIQLLDFGATRRYDETRRRAVHRLLAACVAGDDGDIERAAEDVGYTDGDDPRDYTQTIVRLLRTATEPARNPGQYRFGTSDLAQRMGEIVVDMRMRSRYGRLPPTDVLFLHRKLGGLYLLLSRLKSSVPVRKLVAPYVDSADSTLPVAQTA